jgi:Tol biopolymer transport system component
MDFFFRKETMKKNFYPLIALLVLVATALACASPLGGGSNQPSSSDQVATVVAATFQALTPVTSGGETPVPESEGILPQALYYLNNDKTGIPQVFRLAPDAKTIAQLTFEPSAVNAYDVSMADGSIVYVANNQVLLVNADGSGRRILVDGGPVDPNNPFTTSVSGPVFSPNGQTIAYSSNKGLNLYVVSTGASNIVLERKSDSGSPAEMYIPQKYSPDGTKLLLTTAIPNSDGISSGIYNITTNTLVRLAGGDGARLCCTQQAWTSDSSALYVGISSVGMFGSGLWRVDASSGNLTTLLPTEAGGGAYNLASFPYLAPDGNLYFFYNTAISPDGMVNRAPLQIVRSAVDGVTSRTILRPETFETLNEVLWAPDASFVIVAKASDSSVYEGGAFEIYSIDGTKSMVPLLPFGWQLKWGR